MNNYESIDITIDNHDDILHGEVITVSNEKTFAMIQADIQDDPQVAGWDEEIFYYIPDEVYEMGEKAINKWLIDNFFDETEAGGDLI